MLACGSGAVGAGNAPNAAAAAAAFPHDVLVRIFSLLPRGALAVTPGRVSRAWAAAKKEAVHADTVAVMYMENFGNRDGETSVTLAHWSTPKMLGAPWLYQFF